MDQGSLLIQQYSLYGKLTTIKVRSGVSDACGCHTFVIGDEWNKYVEEAHMQQQMWPTLYCKYFTWHTMWYNHLSILSDIDPFTLKLRDESLTVWYTMNVSTTGKFI